MVFSEKEDSPSAGEAEEMLERRVGDIILSNGGSFQGLLRQKGTKTMPCFH